MKCPYCENQKTKVIDSRTIDEGGAIRRRRHCFNCGSRFTTFERREKARSMAKIGVKKRDGDVESFDREKLAKGLYLACNKRNIAAAVIEDILDDIEDCIIRGQGKEVSSSAVGEMVMERLRQLDDVAYVRFASVCKKYSDVSEFHKELGGLMAEEIDRPA